MFQLNIYDTNYNCSRKIIIRIRNKLFTVKKGYFLTLTIENENKSNNTI